MQAAHYITLAVAFVLPLVQADETVLGLYIFSRHGDRTAKSTPPTILTELGYLQIFDSGSYFRDTYIRNGANKKIYGLNPDKVSLSQITASAPLDNVLMSSATGFFQGLYPPVGNQSGTAGLRNGSQVIQPLNGYQIVPIQQSTSGTGSEDSAWLQGASNCQNALVSSNSYYNSTDYYNELNNTKSFYSGIAPVVANTFHNTNDVNFFNAYTIYDLINVAEIHNSTFPSSNLIDNNTFTQLRTLADVHEFNLAYNKTEPIRAIAGSTLAGQILTALNTTINASGKKGLLNVQFGAYGSFQSFFGLSNLTSLPGVGTQFLGIPDYASAMVFELFTNSSPSPFPAVSDLQMRFYFHNGSSSADSKPVQYPLFGSTSNDMSYSAFVQGMNNFSISDQNTWCNACGNNTGVCQASSNNSSGSSVSPAVGGVIGAFVTIAVLLALVLAAMLCLGMRCIRRPRKMGPNGIRHEKGVVTS